MRPRGRFCCHQEANSYCLVWGTGNSPYRFLRQELTRTLTLNPYMKPDAADINPIGRQPSNREKEIQSAPFDAHFDIDSMVLNAPVADVYAYCSRFEELLRFITSLRDAQKIDETLFWPTSLLRGESRGPSCRLCCVFRSGELHGKHSRTIFRVVSFCSSRSLIG
jgi:hypothetical protein